MFIEVTHSGGHPMMLAVDSIIFIRRKQMGCFIQVEGSREPLQVRDEYDVVAKTLAEALEARNA